ncbi:MAG: exodeoxyribonuclease VII large subunit [Deltaproteobacteria bacterium]|nr:MAG: exodeoxyribonuclease VII large subunit [Deltaproteobacteria bacterium]
MQPEFPFLTTRKVYSVSELVASVSELLTAHFGAIFLEGEITNLRQPSSGHLYFTLKDTEAQLKGVVFRRQLNLFDFTPEDGMQVLCRGRLAVYEARGDLQVIVDYMEPSGRGAARIALEKLKKKLAAEGLFDEARKKPLPALPRVIGVVTSPTGAAIRDILKVIRKRNRKVTVRIYPARVQGELAADEIAEGIAYFNRHKFADVLIVGRGGGSAEDLDAFNTEKVVRAIAASEIPVISAVGHEIDITLSDLAADRRAPTPTAAAEIVILESEQWFRRIEDDRKRLVNDFRLILQRKRLTLQGLESQLTDPRHRLSLLRFRLDDVATRLSSATSLIVQNRRFALMDYHRRLLPHNPARSVENLKSTLKSHHARLQEKIRRLVDAKRNSLTHAASLLDSYNPRNVLQRGYSITLKERDQIVIKDAEAVPVGETVKVILARGALGCEVKRHSS